ncbi:MAG: ABC transporter ATP-binding protein [Acidisphaera sp.]|nr:ABC transporter ATP-binding protein [Acidisphaera sp.]MBV9811422.1 ABC transporter ATP-binding protein [Acetobacteraceae bacterium]
MIVDGVTLDVPDGATLGLLGPNGSGKSSLLRLIAGLRRVSSGVVTLDGRALAGLGRSAARRLAFVEQTSETDSPVTVLDIVRLGRTPHRGMLSAWTAADDDAVETALARTDMGGRRDQIWQTLSGGERQRTQIARALAQCPHELLLDEPTNHLDIRHQLDILALVSRMPVTTIAALHDVNLAAMFCDVLAILRNGRLIAAGPPADVLTPAMMHDVFGVRAEVRRDVDRATAVHVRFLA